MATSDYEGKKFTDNGSERTFDALTVEEALQININEEPFTLTMRTPGNDVALVRGLLHSEGIINDRNWTPDILLKKENCDGIVTVVDVKIPEDKLGKGYANSRSLLSVSSCGICGRKELEDLEFMGRVLDQKEQINLEVVNCSFEKMNAVQNAFRKSGGSHAAAAFDVEGNLLCCMEDIGRHNATDKVIGELLMTNEIDRASLITISGRVSYEIIIKTFKAKIPVLCAVSAPSSLSVDYAKELGISLLAFCRDGRATCYAHPYRITNKQNNIKAG